MYLCSKTIIHAIKCKAMATLVVPKWTPAASWPCTLVGKIRSGVLQMFLNLRVIGNFQMGSYRGCLFASDRFQLKVLAIRTYASF